MKSINVSLSSQQLRDILHVVTNEGKEFHAMHVTFVICNLLMQTAIPGKGMEFEEFVFLSLFLARYFQKINGKL